MRIGWRPHWFSRGNAGFRARNVRKRRRQLLASKRQRAGRGAIGGPRAQWVRVEGLEDRTLLSAVSWTGTAGDNQWNTAKKWSTDAVPGSSNTVTIDAPANTVIQLTSSVSVQSISTNAELQLSGSLTVQGGITLNGGTSIQLGDSTGLIFDGSETLGGSGTVSLTGANCYVVAQGKGTQAGAATLTIGSGITIDSTATSGSIGTSYSFDSFINQGIISGDGAHHTLYLEGNDSNPGTLEATNGATLDIAGTIEDSNSTSIDSTSTLIVAGTLSGTISTQSGSTITGTGTLNSATLTGSASIVSSDLTITGGLTLGNGTAIPIDGLVVFDGTQTLSGDGTINLVVNPEYYNYEDLVAQGNGTQAGAATLTIGSGITIDSTATSGSIGTSYSFDSFINQGIISVDGANHTLYLEGNGSNPGTLEATNGATLDIAGTIEDSNSTSIDSTSTLIVAGTLSGTISTQSGSTITGTGTLNSATLTGSARIVSSDLTITGGLTLGNGTAIPIDGLVVFDGTQTLSGDGTINLVVNPEYYNYEDLVAQGNGTRAGAATLTIGSGITIDSSAPEGIVGAGSDYDAIFNQGTIAADGANATLTFEGFSNSST